MGERKGKNVWRMELGLSWASSCCQVHILPSPMQGELPSEDIELLQRWRRLSPSPAAPDSVQNGSKGRNLAWLPVVSVSYGLALNLT